MSEAIWVNINFRAPHRWVEWVERWEPEYIQSADITADEKDPDIFFFSYGLEGNYGLWDDEITRLLDALREHKVPFTAESEAKYEYEGERWVFTGEHTWYGCVMGEHTVLTDGIYRDIQARRSTYESIDEYFAKVGTTAGEMSIDHLQAFPPPDEDEALSFDEVEDAGLDGTLRDM